MTTSVKRNKPIIKKCSSCGKKVKFLFDLYKRGKKTETKLCIQCYQNYRG